MFGLAPSSRHVRKLITEDSPVQRCSTRGLCFRASMVHMLCSCCALCLFIRRALGRRQITPSPWVTDIWGTICRSERRHSTRQSPQPSAGERNTSRCEDVDCVRQVAGYSLAISRVILSVTEMNYQYYSYVLWSYTKTYLSAYMSTCVRAFGRVSIRECLYERV